MESPDPGVSSLNIPHGNPERTTMAHMGRHNTETVTVQPVILHRVVLGVVAAVGTCTLLDVFPTWVSIGYRSAFPLIGRMPTDWTLAVEVEAYWSLALCVWLAAPAGRRSTRFAISSAAGVIALSLTGQGWYHWVTAHSAAFPGALVVFASMLPVVILALIALLVHLWQADRERAAALARAVAKAAEERAEAAQADDERAALRAQLEEAQDALRAETGALRAALDAAETAHQEAAEQAAQSAAKAETLARKLDAQRARNRAPQKGATPARKTTPADRATEVPDDVDARREALAILANEPGISGAQLGLRVGMSKRWGQLVKPELVAAPPCDVVDRTDGDEGRS